MHTYTHIHASELHVYTFMHIIQKNYTCIYQLYTYIYHMDTCVQQAPPKTYVHHQTPITGAYMHHVHIHAPHANMCTTYTTKHICMHKCTITHTCSTSTTKNICEHTCTTYTYMHHMHHQMCTTCTTKYKCAYMHHIHIYGPHAPPKTCEHTCTTYMHHQTHMCTTKYHKI